MKLKLHLRVISLLVAVLAVAQVYADIPPGYYYHAGNLNGAELKTMLGVISKPITVLSYGSGAGATWEGFYATDRLENEVVCDIYSPIIRHFDGFNGVSGMNIEHSLPKSWWGGIVNSVYKDLFHLYPSDDKTNLIKSNLPLGKVGGIITYNNGVSKIGNNTWGNTYLRDCFEPADEFKGDFARSYLYISTIYEELYDKWNSPMMDNNTYPVWNTWALELLMAWHQNDPVSDKERVRNEAIYSIQGNRNPFIDYPDLVDYIWGDKSSSAYPFPAETQPFMVYPRAGSKLDLGILMVGCTNSQPLEFQSANLKSNLEVSLKGNAAFTLSKSSIDMAEATEGSYITVTFHPQTAGLLVDTIVFASQDMIPFELPISGLASTAFMTTEADQITPVGGRLKWTAHLDATEYLVSLYRDDKNAGDLIISAYVEGDSYNKAIELYNGTGSSIDLSQYSLRRQSNGLGAFVNDTPLEGTLDNGKTFVIVHQQCTLTALNDKSNFRTTDVMNFNGNDAVALYRNGIMIDVVGVVNDASDWGKDQTFERSSKVTHPSTHFDKAEWNVFANNHIENIGAHEMTLHSESRYQFEDMSVGVSTSFNVSDLLPDHYYTYSVKAITTQGTVKSVNTTQLRTEALEAPEVLAPVFINESSFEAHWESNPYINDYLFSLYRTEGSDIITNEFGFDEVGTSGKPVPQGWTSTASGNYTTAASSGKAIPSIALKKDGEYIQTNIHDAPITMFGFMYRYASAATGSKLTVETWSNDTWKVLTEIPYANTSKYNPAYKFTSEDDVRAVKISYNKVAGNIAIDDVVITYGASDTIYLEKNIPVTGTQYSVHDLSPNTYYYKTRIIKDDYTSPESASMEVFIDKPIVGIEDNHAMNIVIQMTHDGVEINGLTPATLVDVYKIDGTILLRAKANDTLLQLPIKESGIYLVKISGVSTVYKIRK